MVCPVCLSDVRTWSENSSRHSTIRKLVLRWRISDNHHTCAKWNTRIFFQPRISPFKLCGGQNCETPPVGRQSNKAEQIPGTVVDGLHCYLRWVSIWIIAYCGSLVNSLIVAPGLEFLINEFSSTITMQTENHFFRH